MFLVLAGVWLGLARQLRRREQLDRAAPGAGHDVLTLVRQGRKIEAIKRYRDLNPGITLREAKDAIDEL
jgi:ribosomal protein L7/L12